jgi:hypothetical protein
MTSTNAAKGLRQFLDAGQQCDWREGGMPVPDAAEREESLELRFKYTARFEKLRRRPQATQVLDILRLYGATCLPIPRRTERWYWSVSCLPSTDKTLARVNASWMELFALQPDGDGIRARFILHLADFTADGSPEPDQLDTDLVESCAGRAGDVSHSIWRDNRGILIAKVRGAESIRRFIEHPHSRRAIRNFNLTHMNRGRNAYQASHCYSIADYMVGEA